MSKKVFGVDLEVLTAAEKSEIPKIVSHILEYLYKKKAHLEEGIFRISGNGQTAPLLKKEWDTKGFVDLFKVKELDVHTASGLLKSYLRDLPVPVIIPRYYSTFLKVSTNKDPRQKVINFRKLVNGLPKPNKLLLLSILSFLHLVADNQSANKMSSLNLALIFAPNLMRAEKETLNQIMEDADRVAGTLNTLIQEIDYLRTGDEPEWFKEHPETQPEFTSPTISAGGVQLRVSLELMDKAPDSSQELSVKDAAQDVHKETSIESTELADLKEMASKAEFPLLSLTTGADGLSSSETPADHATTQGELNEVEIASANEKTPPKEPSHLEPNPEEKLSTKKSPKSRRLSKQKSNSELPTSSRRISKTPSDGSLSIINRSPPHRSHGDKKDPDHKKSPSSESDRKLKPRDVQT